MGTRGNYGILINGKLYVLYNSMDSYPSGLGIALVIEILWANLERWKSAISKIRRTPTEADIFNLRKSTDLNLGEQSTHDWFCLTMKNHGSFVKDLQSGYWYSRCGGVVSVDETDNFQLSNYFGNEWGYLVDFDSNMFCSFDYGEQVDEMTFPLDQIPQDLFTQDWSAAYRRRLEQKQNEEKAKEEDDGSNSKPKICETK